MFSFIILFSAALIWNVQSATDLPIELPHERCDISDEQCQKEFFQSIAAKFAKTGIEALNIPVIDPYYIENIDIEVFGMVMRMVKGYAPGISTCKILKFQTDIKTFTRRNEIICKKITIEGDYTAEPNPLINFITWSSINAAGNISLELGDWFFRIEYPFEFIRGNDDQIYVNPKYDQADYVSEVRGYANLQLDGFKFGDVDVSEYVMSIFNENWDFIMRYMSDSFHEKSMEELFKSYRPLFKSIPATSILTNDLTPYVVNDTINQI